MRINPKKLKLNERNPRFIKDEKFAKLVQSIKDFPEMLEKRPIVVDENLIVLGGNMRLRAVREAGLKEVPYMIAEGWTEKQKEEFIIKDNVGFGEWDWDNLFNEWDTDELQEWGLEIPIEEEEKESDKTDLSDLADIEYKIEVEVNSEREQEALFNDLTEKGYKCRVLTL